MKFEVPSFTDNKDYNWGQNLIKIGSRDPDHPISTFCIAFHIFEMGGDRVYKFGRQS